ncbi:hypothetical protein [Streptomyces sp. DH10]|uniref:hypothetical protein n=1 Tax=Streptomyces sp. DH10 TaxID=3040121 RepID=UPI002442498A|nr:hypothetical protein [Streptomyces sp. DH10]MDG9713003.1 hypothetical protein [Streptomyces sp. DH10]
MAHGEKVSTRNPVLARELLHGLADLVHPHGRIDQENTLAGYLTGIRVLTNGLSELGFTGGAAELTRGRLAALWMSGKHRPVQESRARMMLRRLDDLQGVLRPDVRELVDGRRFVSDRRRDRKYLQPYSETEWARLTEVCRTAVKESYAAHRLAVKTAESARDPREGDGWTDANMLWLYAQLGPVEAAPFATWSSSHPSGLPRTRFRWRRSWEAAKLFPNVSTMLGYRLLFGVYTGIVPDGLDDLGLTDVDWAGDRTILLNYIKGRTAEESRTLTTRATRLLRQWTDHSALARQFAPPDAREALWVRYDPHDHGPWVTRPATVTTIRQWVVDRGLMGDDGKPLAMNMHRIRTTYDSMRDRRAWAGSRRATLDPNRSPQVEGDHYLKAGTPKQRELVDEIIAEAQNDMLRRAEAPVVLADEDVAVLVRDYPEKVAALGLNDEALDALVGGARDVFTAACGDQLSGLHGPKGQPCPARPWVCLLCPLALFTPRHLPNLMRLRAFFARQWDQMTQAEFMGVFGRYDQRLAELLAPDAHFTSKALLAATAQVIDDDTELPLRPEEGTR